MKIDRNNYKFYLALYHEKSLDPVRTAELMLFISENPYLEEFLDYPAELLLNPDQLSFYDKEQLKKDFCDVSAIHESNFDEFCIAYAEGLLSESDKIRLNKYLDQHPDKKNDFLLYQQLQVEPNLHIRYPSRASLKKSVPFFVNRKIILLTASIAAAIVLLFLLFSVNPEKPSNSNLYSSQDESSGTIFLYYKKPPQLSEEPSAAVADRPSVSFTRISPASSIDETDPETRAQVSHQPALKSINPVHTISLVSYIPHDITLSSHDPYLHQAENSQLDSIEDPYLIEPSVSGFLSYVRNLNAWETTRLLVKGFNALTESSLSIEKVSDDEGNIQELIIDTDERKILSADLSPFNL